MNKLGLKCNLIKNELALVEERLQQVVEQAGPEISSVGSYIFNGSGKRVRPTLFLLAAYDSNARLVHYVDAAVALELIHTASLLHDDVIDQAPTRRNKDTVHARWGNKVSILTGDYLLSEAFKILVGYQEWPLMDVIVNMVKSMTEGEIEQTFATADSSELEERYFNWIGKKSASFFAGCCRVGKMLGGGDSKEQNHWEEFGYNLGMTFQLIDDLLDYTGKGEKTGKPIYGDLHNRVITLPLIRSMKHASENKGTFPKQLHHEGSSSHFSEMVQAVLESDGPEYTYKKAQEYINLAEKAVDQMVTLNPKVKAALKDLSAEVLNRKQ